MARPVVATTSNKAAAGSAMPPDFPRRACKGLSRAPRIDAGGRRCAFYTYKSRAGTPPMSSFARRTVLLALAAVAAPRPHPTALSAPAAPRRTQTALRRYQSARGCPAPPLAGAKSSGASRELASTSPSRPAPTKTKIFILSSGSPTRSSSETAAGTGVSTAANLDLPVDGSDPRYHAPASRWPPPPPPNGSYLDDQGVNDTNVAFCGHPRHSDHIANADDIIYEYRPKVILSPEYSDNGSPTTTPYGTTSTIYDRLVPPLLGGRQLPGTDRFTQRLDGC